MVRAWSVVLLCSVMMLMGAGPVYYAYGNYAVAFAKEFGAGTAIINIGFTMVQIVGNLGSAPIGMALDRFGVRWTASFGVVGTAAGFALVAVSNGIWQIVILFGTLIALADVCIGVVSTSYLVSHWFERRRGLALGLSVLGASAAAIVFPPLTDLLIQDHGWRTTFLIYAAAMLALLPPILWLARVPEDFPDAERIGREKRAPGPPIALSALFRHRGFWILSLVTGVMTGANTGTMVSLVNYAASRGLTTAQGSLLLSTIGLCAVIGKVAIGLGIDRMNHANAMRIGVGLQMGGMILFAVAPSHATMLIAAATFGFGVGAMLPVWSAGLAALFGLGGYGRALGWSRAVMTPVAMVFPLAAGAFFDSTGSYTLTWLSFAAALALAFVSLFAMPRQERPAPAP